ncbi:PREDICTED: uncharacterized protein LOC108555607 [Eufriesea mexicana]|uniref:uncharacterized protein LOC108555607 n=1 Tax=Eufriesea mexicana TaxID=516756 RepID=UPI00083BC797|nr:PREDICTED: uncharacterized protein LOC108555607 [Eufriesea mexicana]
MFIKFILICSMFSFVCARSIENEVQLSTMFAGTRSDSVMDTNEPTITEEECVLQVRPTHASRSDTPITSHESTTHTESSHPKKRATNYKEDRTDLRPGCCR